MIRPEKANHRILSNFSKTSTCQDIKDIKGKKMVPSSVGEIDLHQSSNLNLNLQSTVSKEDHQSTPTTQPFSPVIISVESLANASSEDSSPFHQSAANASYENYSSLLRQSAANAINEDNSLLCQSVALPASSMEVLANSKPIMFLVKNRHNCSQMGTQSAGIKDKVTRFIALTPP